MLSRKGDAIGTGLAGFVGGDFGLALEGSRSCGTLPVPVYHGGRLESEIAWRGALKMRGLEGSDDKNRAARKRPTAELCSIAGGCLGIGSSTGYFLPVTVNAMTTGVMPGGASTVVPCAPKDLPDGSFSVN